MAGISSYDITLDTPLYTYAEAARFLGVPTSTFSTWAKGYVRRPAGRRAVVGESIVSSISVKPGFAAVPFAGLTEVVSRQRVFAPVVAEYLRRIEYGSDGWPVRLVSPATDRPVMVVDPTRSFGQPIFIHGAARMEDVLDRWRAGDALTEVAADFGVPLEDVEDVLRVSLPAAA